MRLQGNMHIGFVSTKHRNRARIIERGKASKYIGSRGKEARLDSIQQTDSPEWYRSRNSPQ